MLTPIGQWDLQDNADSSVVVATYGDDGVFNSDDLTPANTSTASVAGPGPGLPLALNFDGATSYVEIENMTTGITAFPFAFTYWHKPSAIGANITPVSLCDTAVINKYFAMFVDTTGDLEATRRNTTAVNTDSTQDSVAGTWEFNAVVFNSETSLTIYKDNTYANTFSPVTSVALTGGTFNDFEIGRVKGITLLNYAGAIAGVRLYAETLSADDVAAIRLEGLTPPASGNGFSPLGVGIGISI